MGRPGAGAAERGGEGSYHCLTLYIENTLDVYLYWEPALTSTSSAPPLWLLDQFPILEQRGDSHEQDRADTDQDL